MQASDWTYKSYKLDAYTNKNIKIAFKSVSNKAGSGSATSNHFLDNVIIEDVSLCAYPMNLELVSVSQNSASIMWTIDLDGGGYLPSAYRITVKDESENIVGDYDDFVFENDYSNYWGYYGPFVIEVDTETAKCDLNGATEPYAVPTTVVLEQVDIEEGAESITMGTGEDKLTSKYGFLTYKNNGVNVSEFNVYVKVKVTYGWGVIMTDYIKVKVDSTIAAK